MRSTTAMEDHKPFSFFSNCFILLSSLLCCFGCLSYNTGLSISQSSSTANTGVSTSQSSSTAISLPSNINSSWHLTFDDEFNGTTIDWSKWKDGGQNFGTGTGNEEQETYVPDADKVSNGILRIRADKRNVNGYPY